MKIKRDGITKKVLIERLAAALRDHPNVKLDWLHARNMTAEQVCSLVQWDHAVTPHAIGGPLTHWNLDPVLIMAHRAKTPADRKIIAKHDRRIENNIEHAAKMANKLGLNPPAEPQDKPKRQWPKGRKMGTYAVRDPVTGQWIETKRKRPMRLDRRKD